MSESSSSKGTISSSKEALLDDLSDETAGGLRGFVRGYMRRFVKNFSLGSLPLQHNTKSIGKTIGNVNQVLDVSQALSETEVDKQKLSYVQRLRAAAPLLAKNSILGSLQFGAYDTVVGITRGVLNMREDYHAIPLSFFAGFVSGTAHGTGHLLWEYLHGTFKGKERPLRGVSRRGTLLLHSMSHCTLFTSYQSFRFILHPSPSTSIETVDMHYEGKDKEGKQIEIAHRFISSALAGFLAGVCEEIINHRYASLEIKQDRRWQRAPLGSLQRRALLLAGVPSAVGFLALEFT